MHSAALTSTTREESNTQNYFTFTSSFFTERWTTITFFIRFSVFLMMTWDQMHASRSQWKTLTGLGFIFCIKYCIDVAILFHLHFHLHFTNIKTILLKIHNACSRWFVVLWCQISTKPPTEIQNQSSKIAVCTLTICYNLVINVLSGPVSRSFEILCKTLIFSQNTKVS